MVETNNASDLLAELNGWKNQLRSCRDEIKQLRHQLVEVAGRLTSKDAAVQTEHFQNQFFNQEEVIHDTLENVKRADRQMLAFSTVGDSDADSPPNHHQLRDQMSTFSKLYKELTDDFAGFMHGLK
jgi:uncharacterized protein YhdP